MTVVVKELKGDVSPVLSRFVLFVLTLLICENCTAIGSGDNVQYKQNNVIPLIL